MKNILVINGPNINMLGIREPEIYGAQTYEVLLALIGEWAEELDCQVECFQSNHEGDIVDEIQAAYGQFDGIVINPAAYTHTSVAILDALSAVSIPFIEIHISNVHAREEFRHHSFLSHKALGVIVGFGLDGYRYALDKAVRYIKQKQ